MIRLFIQYVILITLVSFLLCVWILRPRRSKMTAAVLMTLYTVTALLLTVLRSQNIPGGNTILMPLGLYYRLVTAKKMTLFLRLILAGELAGNVVLLVPPGLMLSQRVPERRGAALSLAVGFLCSLCIECWQYVTALGTFEVDDLIHNTWGALIGYSVGRALTQYREGAPMRQLVSTLCPLIVFVVLLGTCVTVSLLRWMMYRGT